eukprot:g12770.t1
MPWPKLKSLFSRLAKGSQSGKFSTFTSEGSGVLNADHIAALENPQKEEVDIRDVYDIGRILGSGSFGQVREARCRQGGNVRAVKIVEADDTDGEWSRQVVFVREVGLLQQLDHENIVKFYDFFEDPDFYYIVMEFYTGGELFQRILEVKRFSECDAAFLGFQMLLALEYIHSLRIVHRDVKAENFLFTSAGSIYNTPLKLIDFGMAILHELCGSPHYLAPELIGQQYNHLVDLWALGVLLYLLLYGRYPYDAKDPQELMVKILTEKIEWRHPKAKITETAKEFLNCLLDRDVRSRYTSKRAMRQNWIGQNMLRVETHIKPVNKTNILALKYIQELIREGKHVMPLSRHNSKEVGAAEAKDQVDPISLSQCQGSDPSASSEVPSSASEEASASDEESEEDGKEADTFAVDDTDYEPIAIPKEVLHMARRSSIATRKLVDTSFETVRNQKLEFIQQEYKRGLRYGHRMGGPTPSPSEAYNGSFAYNNGSFMMMSGESQSRFHVSPAAAAALATDPSGGGGLFSALKRRMSTLMFSGAGAEGGSVAHQKSRPSQPTNVVPNKRNSKGPDVATRMSLNNQGSLKLKTQPGSTSFFMQQNNLSFNPQGSRPVTSGSTILQNGAAIGNSGTLPDGVAGGPKVPRRLSYIGGLAPGQEKQLKAIYGKNNIPFPETIPETIRESTASAHGS